MDTCTYAHLGTHVNACIPNHRVELRKSLVALVTKVYSMDLGENGVETVSSRPMAICRPIDVPAYVNSKRRQSKLNLYTKFQLSGNLYHL